MAGSRMAEHTASVRLTTEPTRKNFFCLLLSHAQKAGYTQKEAQNLNITTLSAKFGSILHICMYTNNRLKLEILSTR